MTEKTWVRHLKAEDILDLQSLMLLLAGQDMEERESAFKGMLEILNPVVVGVRSMWRENRELAVASVDMPFEIRRLKEKVNRLITDRLFPGAINDNDLKREVI